jgi:hypothetical protein
LQEQIEYASICSGDGYGYLIGAGGVTLATQEPTPAILASDEGVDVNWVVADNAPFPGSSLTDGVYTQVESSLEEMAKTVA